MKQTATAESNPYLGFVSQKLVVRGQFKVLSLLEFHLFRFFVSKETCSNLRTLGRRGIKKRGKDDKKRTH